MISAIFAKIKQIELSGGQIFEIKVINCILFIQFINLTSINTHIDVYIALSKQPRFPGNDFLVVKTWAFLARN